MARPRTPAQQLETVTRERARTKGRQRTVYETAQGKNRYELTNRARAVKSARQKQGRLIARGEYDAWINQPSSDSGQNLKSGILGIATRAGMSIENEELWTKLQYMDPAKLADMYSKNELIFDVAFNYGGSDKDTDMDTRKGENVIPGKIKDLEFLVEMYERGYGPIL